MSIRARLLLIALLATVLPVLIVLDHFLDDRRKGVEVNTGHLAAIARDKADDLLERIRGTRQLHFGLGRAADLHGGDRAACSAFLSEVREANPQYTGIITIRPDGRLFCDSLRSGRELDLNDRAYFRRALKADAGDVVLEPVFGRITGRAVLQVASAVRDAGGGLQFVLLASIDLGKLAPGDTRQVPGATVLMVDDKGVVLASTPAGATGLVAGASVAGTRLFAFAQAGPEAAAADLEMPDGRHYTWARADAQALADAGVHVLAGAPTAELVAAADRDFAGDALLMAVLAAVVFLAVWLVSERAIRQPIAQISGLTQALAAGRLDARIEAPLPRGELGALMGELNQAAQALHTQRQDIERLNARLLQSQRLEAIGQLTGGVAHDFNNLLTVVLGNADLLVEACAEDPACAPLVQGIVEAAERGAALTQQLLAFARKQPLQPSEVNVNQRLAAIDPMLRRTLGEHIEIEFVRAAGLWPALVDVAQLESAMLNLCLNARDAMPGGGKLTVETANAALDAQYAAQHADVQPGQFVMVAVSDTGTGIAPAQLSRVFEPFFTTKEKGKGTGLGLAMVYGFVRQSAGHVSIYSELGHGTTVKLYLPRAEGGGVAAAPPGAETAVRGGAETVLVVEDDEPVRHLACTELRALGYRVLEAASGAEALPLLQSDETVDLLFTDVVMPGGLSGRQLADEAQRLRPGLRVLYTSGYTENAIVHHGRLDAGVQLLPKPYRRADLARAVRQAFGRPN